MISSRQKSTMMRLTLFLCCIALAKCGSQASLRRAPVDNLAARKMLTNSGASHLRAYKGTEKGGGVDAVHQQKAPKKGGKGGGANNYSAKNHGTKKSKRQKCEFPSTRKKDGIIVTQKAYSTLFPPFLFPHSAKEKDRQEAEKVEGRRR